MISSMTSSYISSASSAYIVLWVGINEIVKIINEAAAVEVIKGFDNKFLKCLNQGQNSFGTSCLWDKALSISLSSRFWFKEI